MEVTYRGPSLHMSCIWGFKQSLIKILLQVCLHQHVFSFPLTVSFTMIHSIFLHCPGYYKNLEVIWSIKEDKLQFPYSICHFARSLNLGYLYPQGHLEPILCRRREMGIRILVVEQSQYWILNNPTVIWMLFKEFGNLGELIQKDHVE